MQARDYARGPQNVVALKKELEAYQLPDPTVDEIGRLDRLIEEAGKAIGRHQKLLISVSGTRRPWRHRLRPKPSSRSPRPRSHPLR